jgi:hypothetical protein
MDKISLDYNLNLGIFLSKVINDCPGGKIFRLIISYPLISGKHIQDL